MADINQFLRSKDRLTEIYYYLMTKSNVDEQTGSYITILEKSIKTLEKKIEEFGDSDQASEMSA
jgi:hypothetical protein